MNNHVVVSLAATSSFYEVKGGELDFGGSSTAKRALDTLPNQADEDKQYGLNHFIPLLESVNRPTQLYDNTVVVY